MASDKFSPEQIEEAESLFNKPCNFVLSVAKLDQLPLTEMGEVAFAGRSNVGKSSLINALFNQRKLAKTSSTPGRTQQLNYFNLADKIHLVDLPGYGFAQAPEDKISAKALADTIKRTEEIIKKHGAAYVDILATSSEKNRGLDELKAEINSLI